VLWPPFPDPCGGDYVSGVRSLRSLGLAVAGLAAAALMLGTVPASASPAAARPAITSLKAAPSPVGAGGGKVTVTAKVRSGRTCTFAITPKVAGFPLTRRCGTGTVAATLKFPANRTIATRHFTIKLTVKAPGHTATASVKLAQPPLTLAGVTSVVGQGESYCALVTSGDVYCWGSNNYGQLGNGTTKNSSRPVAVSAVGGKGRLTGVASVVADAFGYGSQYCAVLRSGGVDCWGLNGDGQLGNGTTKQSDTPVAVLAVGGTGLLTGAKQVQPEIYGFCARLSSGGTACWGLNENGQLGDNTLTGPDSCGADENPCSTTPVTVVTTAGTGALSQVSSIVAEGESMCALLTTSGVDCWGYGPNGQLGNGSESGSSYPVAVEGLGGTGSLTGVTILTGGNDSGTSICARLSSGRADCWGDDTWGELGNGTTGLFNDSDVPVAVEGVGGQGTLGSVARVTGVPGQTNCAVLTSGGVDCWGYAGAIGDPSVTGLVSNVPVKVVGPGSKGTLGGVSSLAVGDNGDGGNVCALLTSGGVDCWGFTSSGLSTAPKAVSGFGSKKPLIRVRALVSDEDGSTCALLATGGVDCWGADVVGQLGNGTTSGSYVPVPVLAPA
jgi:alpha-tubulin suppressor-like RCC1 family protein